MRTLGSVSSNFRSYQIKPNLLKSGLKERRGQRDPPRGPPLLIKKGEGRGTPKIPEDDGKGPHRESPQGESLERQSGGPWPGDRSTDTLQQDSEVWQRALGFPLFDVILLNLVGDRSTDTLQQDSEVWHQKGGSLRHVVEIFDHLPHRIGRGAYPWPYCSMPPCVLRPQDPDCPRDGKPRLRLW